MRLLIAASVDIRAEGWMARHVAAALQQFGGRVTMFGRNESLSRVLAACGVDVVSVSKDAKATRGELRELISSIDYLLLFWNGIEHTQLLFEARLQGKKMKVIPFESTTVVNRDRGDEFDVYIGRGTPWGNPYPVGQQEGQYSREEAIERYRVDFYKKLESEPSFGRVLLGLRGKRLACFCKPLACHGDIIANYLNSQPPTTDTETV